MSGILYNKFTSNSFEENKKDALIFIKSISSDIEINVIDSKGDIFVEEPGQILRCWERLLYKGIAGRCKNFKEKL